MAETWLGNRRSQKCCSCFTFPINLSSNFFEPPCQYRRKLSIRLTCFNAPRMDGVEPALLLSLFEYLSVRVVLQPTVKGGEWEFDHFPRAWTDPVKQWQAAVQPCGSKPTIKKCHKKNHSSGFRISSFPLALHGKLRPWHWRS